MKKILGTILVCALALTAFTSCGGSGNSSIVNSSIETDKSSSEVVSDFDTNKDITVVSREDGSGTRGAFIELFGIEEKGDDGSRKDLTTEEAIIANKTGVMMTNIANDPYGIGYISLGSVNDTINTLDINGIVASSENVKNKTYEISRPFNIATKGEPTGLTKDFINFILSKEGQEVVSKSYISISDTAESFTSDKSTGKITVAGSSSVTPIMEKLKEAYIAINSAATIDIQMTDSTAGMTGVLDGSCDIGMASRNLKDTELASLTSVEIALDGIAVIVNKENPISNLKSEDIKKIFTGEYTKWNEIK